MYVHCEVNESCGNSYSDMCTLTKHAYGEHNENVSEHHCHKIHDLNFQSVYIAYTWLDFGQTHMHDPVLKIQF